MSELSFTITKKSSSDTKIILTTNTRFNAEKFISSEEISSLKNSAHKQNFDGKIGSFAEINNGTKRILLAGMGNKPSFFDLQILGSHLYKKILNEQNASIYIPTDIITWNINITKNNHTGKFTLIICCYINR